MIRVEKDAGRTTIHSTVSDFCDSMGYCEHQIPFHIEGTRPPPSAETVQGAMAHDAEEEYEKENFEFVPLTQDELDDVSADVEFPRENIITRFLFPVRMDTTETDLIIYGRADKVFRSSGTLYVQDDKFPTNPVKYAGMFEPFANQKLQALTYLHSRFTERKSFNTDDWFDIPHEDKGWIIRICDKQNVNKPLKIFKGIHNKSSAKFFIYNLQRFTKLVLGDEQRKHHNIVAKCRPCRLADRCEFRLY